jgi:allose kinase
MTSALIVADIGGTKIALGHVLSVETWEPRFRHEEPSNKHEHLKTSTTSTTSTRPLQTVPTELLRVANPVFALENILLEYARTHDLSPTAIVLGVPVSLAKNLDTVLSSPNILQLEGLQLGSMLEARLKIPVRLERDINLLLLGEVYGQNVSSALGVFFGTGIGASFILENRVYRGASVGLEIGHIPIRGEGKICVCGNIDCLEAYACGHTLNALSKQFSIPVADIFIKHGNLQLEQFLFEFVRDQAYAVATAINLFDPELCIIGGGIPEMKAFPRESFHQTILEHLRRPLPQESIKLEWAKLGSRAVLPGALAVLKETRTLVQP